MDMLHIASIVADILAFALAMRLMVKTRDWRLSFLAAMAVLLLVHQWIVLDFSAEHSLMALTGVSMSAMVLLSVFFVGRLIEHEGGRAEALRASEARYRSLFDDTPVMLHSADPDGRLIDVNRHWLEVMGYGRDEVLGAEVTGFLTDESRRRAGGLSVPAFHRGGDTSDVPLSLTTKEGEIIHVLLSSVAEKDEHGEFVSSRTVMIDVTKQREAETFLLEAMESSPDGIVIYDSNDRLKLCNEAFKTGALLGIADLIEPGVRYEQLVRAAVERNLVAIPEGGEEGYVQARLEQHRRDASRIEVELANGRWMLASDRRLPGGGFVGTRSDITDLKRAELALKASRRQAAGALAMLTEAMESNPDAVAIYDADDKLTHFNEAYRAGFSSGLSDLIEPGASFEGLLRAAMERKLVSIPGGDVEGYFNTRLELHRKGGRSLDIEMADGRWLLFSERRMPGGGTVSTRSDITERKRAELALQKSEERLRTMIENIPGVVFRRILHADGSVTFPFLSSQYSKLLGIDSDAAMTDPQVILKRLHPDDRDGWMAAWGKSAESLKPFDREVRISRSANDIRWFRVRAVPRRLADGEILWDAIGIDVTERKRAEDTIRKSEEQLTLITENIPALISYIGRDERFRFANSAYGKSFGASPRKLPGMSLREYWGEESYATFSDKVARVLAGETVSFENELPAKDGGMKHVAVTYVPHIVHGVVEAFFSLATDITQQVATRRALRERGQRIRNILENIADAVITIDERGKIQSFNQAAERMFGYPAAEIIGRAVSKLMPAADSKHHPGYLRNYLETGKGKIIGIGRRDVTARRKNGTTFPASLGVSEMWTGGKRSFIGSLLDMTQQEAAKQALRARDERLHQLQSELLRINRAATIGQLTSSLTHELKQPLAAASFYMQAIGQLLKKDGAKPGKEIAEIIAKVGNQVGRAAAVVDRLGPLFEKGEVERMEVDINDVVAEAVAVAALDLDRKNIDLRTVLGRDLPRLPVDRIQVQQVLLNLVHNAVEATQDSKRRVLTVRTRATKDGEVEVSVSDSGCGVPVDLRSSMFDPFVTTRVGGTGMGLSVSRTIVEAHGGRIWTSPRRGGGTIMRFTLGLAAREIGR